ncbi:hypothetical protein V5O48_015767 [Marasmius crinis-equi]|uniref:Uncharacterized protein n=1 Tax=Marasmius crinis-equi TaxID=585013 RepID=A0ABR3ETQ1_9AGAR
MGQVECADRAVGEEAGTQIPETGSPQHCPHNTVAPVPVPMDKLFFLDVDDEIWQDVGLTDEWDLDKLPPWLADGQEQDAMQQWFVEEWSVILDAIERTVHPDLKYLLELQREHLLQLCVRWHHHVGHIVPSAWVPEWGPSDEELNRPSENMTVELLQKEHWLDTNTTPSAQAGQSLEGYDDEDEEEEVGIAYDEVDLHTIETFDLVAHADQYPVIDIA